MSESRFLGEPMAGPNRGGTEDGPRDLLREREHPDMMVPPVTDSGTLPNLRFSLSDTHVKLCDGGWTREVTEREMPAARTIAGVNMRLDPGQSMTGVRELHWHLENEWAYMISGSARVTILDLDGNMHVDDVPAGDLWFFPTGLPHSIQALEHGCEFLLAFDDGAFSEEYTLLLTDFLSHMPPEVIAKNFGWSAETVSLLPKNELYIFPASVPGPLSEDLPPGVEPGSGSPYTFHMRQANPVECPGGRVTVIDSSSFPITTISCAVVEVDPGGMRELHWHPNNDEWQLFLEGRARMTVFNTGSVARTFNYLAGDVGTVPRATGHYVENIGNTRMRYLALFASPEFQEISLQQWLAKLPPALVKAHLNLPDDVIAALKKDRQLVVAGTPPADQEQSS
ncbi:MAG: cupin domain-containing protein [Thermomicrobiales bacterium]